MRLDAMPDEAVEAVRVAWRPVVTGAECVNHGDVGAGGILVTDTGIALLDWDESRVHVPWFDFAFCPPDVAADVAVDAAALRPPGSRGRPRRAGWPSRTTRPSRSRSFTPRVAVKPQDLGTDKAAKAWPNEIADQTRRGTTSLRSGDDLPVCAGQPLARPSCPFSCPLSGPARGATKG